MGKLNLSDEDLTILSECINNQTEIPEELLLKLSPVFFEKLRKAGQFDYKELDKYKIPTIEYACKRPESVVLAQAAITGGAAPLQIIRSFSNGKNGDWKNLIVQGDNLQFLKTCYLNQDPLIKGKVKGKVKLINIDPPFGTGDEYGSNDGQMSYSAKVMGAEFIESLRESLIYLREILTDDGCIFLRLDYHFGHYMKIVMDEIFGKSNFKNEMVINRIYKNVFGESKFIPTSTDSLYVYSKSGSFNYFYIKKKRDKARESFWRHMDDSAGIRHPQDRKVFNKILSPPQNKHFKYNQKAIDNMVMEGRIRLKCSACGYIHDDPKKDWKKCPECSVDEAKLQYLVQEKLHDNLQSDWTDIAGYSNSTGYPTENSEDLVERVILSGSDAGDLVIDVFGGSGTTAAVAEKLGRRWIVCDFGKHAIYTMQKRILNIADSKKLGTDVKNNEKYGMPPKPFSIVSAGAYDFSRIMNLRQHKDAYISFVLGLFSIMRDEIDYSKKYKLPNIYAEKDNNPVEIYPVWDDEYLKEVRIDEDYLQGIIEASGGKLKGNYYIVVPETCTIITDITLKNSNKEDVNFKLLKFPYKVLEDFSRQFHIAEQPSSQDDINKLISSAGFYFNEEVKIKVEKAKGGFRIVEFDTGILNKNRERFKGLDGLAIVLIDKNYDGEVFSMDSAIYKKEIDDEGIVKIEGLTDKSYLIAIDKHGNESKIIKI